MSFAALIGGAAFELPVDKTAPPRDPDAYTIVGTSYPGPDLPAKLTARHAFVQDHRIEGMLHARVIRPPAIGARLIAAAARDDLTVPRVEVARGTAEGRRGKGKQTRPRCRSRLSNLNAADPDPRAAAGRSLIGREGVSPSISAMRSGERPSSSATIWRSAARAPVPRSTLPANTVTPRPARRSDRHRRCPQRRGTNARIC